MLNTKAGKVQSASQIGGHWQLRPLIVATLLAAEVEPAHPLWVAAKSDPELLMKIDRIADIGGAAGHGGRIEATTRDVEETTELTFRVLSILGIGN
jgi:hypothetical protein